METLRNWYVGTALLFAVKLLVLSGCATGPASYKQNIVSAISGHGSIFVSVSDDVVWIHGWVEERYDYNAILRAALRGSDGRKIVDSIYIRE